MKKKLVIDLSFAPPPQFKNSSAIAAPKAGWRKMVSIKVYLLFVSTENLLQRLCADSEF